MSLSQACINVQFLLQRLLPLPIQLSPSTLEMHRSPSGLHPEQFPRFGWIWYGASRALTPAILFCLGRIHWLSTGGQVMAEMEQLACYTIGVTLAVLLRAVYRSFEQHQDDYCYVMTQRFKSLKASHLGFSALDSTDKAQELFIYSFLFFYAMAVVGFFAFPFIREYDPAQLIAYSILDMILPIFRSISIHLPVISEGIFVLLYRILSKLITGGIYSFIAFHGGGALVSLCVCALSFLEAIDTLSYDLYERTFKYHLGKAVKVNKGHGLLEKLHKSRNTGKKRVRRQSSMTVLKQLAFPEALQLFRVLRILIRTGNDMVEELLVVIVATGMTLGVWSGYVTIKLYNVLPLLIYLGLSLILPLILTVVFLLASMAAIPHCNVEVFKQYWRGKLRGRRERQQLKTCPEIGYSFGPVRMGTKRTGLEIADVIMNGIAELILMKSGAH